MTKRCIHVHIVYMHRHNTSCCRKQGYYFPVCLFLNIQAINPKEALLSGLSSLPRIFLMKFAATNMLDNVKWHSFSTIYIGLWTVCKLMQNRMGNVYVVWAFKAFDSYEVIFYLSNYIIFVYVVSWQTCYHGNKIDFTN